MCLGKFLHLVDDALGPFGQPLLSITDAGGELLDQRVVRPVFARLVLQLDLVIDQLLSDPHHHPGILGVEPHPPEKKLLAHDLQVLHRELFDVLPAGRGVDDRLERCPGFPGPVLGDDQFLVQRRHPFGRGVDALVVRPGNDLHLPFQVQQFRVDPVGFFVEFLLLGGHELDVVAGVVLVDPLHQCEVTLDDVVDHGCGHLGVP